MTPLADAFVAALAPERRAALPEVEALEDRLTGLVAAAARAWPELAVPAEVFVAYLAARLHAVDGLATVQAADLYLACAAVGGDAAALAEVDARLARELTGARARLGADAADAADAGQTLRQRLLTGATPGLGDFEGRGGLGAWLRVSAVRELLMQRRRRGRESPLGDVERIAERAPADPEIAHLKELYRGAFADAVRAAFAGLTPRERNLLRQHYLYSLTLEDMAAAYHVHRATVARWLAGARDALFEATRTTLIARLGIGHGEFDSLARMLHSQLDVSLRALLESGTDAG
jgi:RNA polymerase sigma-70 factor (ECF subfamily)